MIKTYFYIFFIFCTSCQLSPKDKPLPEVTYLDGLTTAKKINCSSNKALHCMACALQGEAANQNAQGVYAVGITIMTRAKGKLNKVCKVTKARGQFEGMRRSGYRKISKKIWKITNHIIEKKETGWTHFWAPVEQKNLNRRKPAWASHFEQRQCLKEKIDDHIFYNKNKCTYKKIRENASN